MSSRIYFYGTASLVALLVWASAAQAELPPGAYDQLKREAQELLEIRIDKVTEKDRISGDMRNFDCAATVLKVDRSKASLATGAKIQFESYFVPPEAYARGFAGPKSPPLLEAGWQGKIYLNRAEGSDDYTLAAYGRSFVPSGASAAAPPTDRLGVRANPASSGGLVVRLIDRDSPADDLGLRPGDRLIEVNGRAVNAITDVAPALQAAKDQLQVKLERRGRPLDLTMRRAQ